VILDIVPDSYALLHRFILILLSLDLAAFVDLFFDQRFDGLFQLGVCDEHPDEEGGWVAVWLDLPQMV